MVDVKQVKAVLEQLSYAWFAGVWGIFLVSTVSCELALYSGVPGAHRGCVQSMLAGIGISCLP